MVADGTKSKELNLFLRISVIVKQGLGHLFISSSSSHFLNKTDLEQYRFKPEPEPDLRSSAILLLCVSYSIIRKSQTRFLFKCSLFYSFALKNNENMLLIVCVFNEIDNHLTHA